MSTKYTTSNVLTLNTLYAINKWNNTHGMVKNEL